MSLDPTVRDAAARALGRPITSASAVAGGDLNDAYRLTLGDGRSAFLKTRAGAHPDEFAGEADGLRWLAEARALPLPEVLAVGESFLALGWIERGRLDEAGEETLGRGLAALHGAGAGSFGSDRPLTLGPLTLPNGPEPTWPELHAERHLRPTAALAAAALPDGGIEAIERLCERLADLAGPPEPPSRLHGDLWSGNVLVDADGRPHLIDPAAYGGHREVDLAMLRLFGGPGERCFRAYDEVAPLAAGYADRVALWQVFPLLVHAFLFGGSYGARAVAIAREYG